MLTLTVCGCWLYAEAVGNVTVFVVHRFIVFMSVVYLGFSIIIYLSTAAYHHLLIIAYLPSSSPTYHHLALGEKQVQSTAAMPYSNRYCVKEIRLLGYSGDSYVGTVFMLRQ